MHTKVLVDTVPNVHLHLEIKQQLLTVSINHLELDLPANAKSR